METSALESINVEVAFNSVLAGNYLYHGQSLQICRDTKSSDSPVKVFLKKKNHIFLWIVLSFSDPSNPLYMFHTLVFALDIHKKVNSKQVVHTPISSVSINSSSTEPTEERKPCCRNIWSQDPQHNTPGWAAGRSPNVTWMVFEAIQPLGGVTFGVPHSDATL